MSNGLKVWDSAGTLIVDITDRLTRFIGVVPVSIPAATAYVDVSYSGIEGSTWLAYPNNNKVTARVFTGYIRCYATPWYIYNSGSSGVSSTISIFRY